MKHLPCSLLLHLSLTALPALAAADSLSVSKFCPVSQVSDEQTVNLGLLAFSHPWYHSSRTNARYTPGDNATGIGLEIHFFANTAGSTHGRNAISCSRYRLLQIRSTTARLFKGERPVQIDIPSDALSPFYDNMPMEHGYGTHLTPQDDQDKPWQGRPVRASTVGIYDTPYVSDGFGVEGRHIRVEFETCVVCERDQGFDDILSCGHWGYQRDYLNEETGWTEPESLEISCSAKPSQRFTQTLESTNRVAYSYWLEWR